MAVKTKSDIITYWYDSKQVHDCIGRMHPISLRDELKQEVFLVLCEAKEELILELESKGQMIFYIAGIITNMIFSSTSNFYRKFRSTDKEVSFAQLSQFVEDLLTHQSDLNADGDTEGLDRTLRTKKRNLNFCDETEVQEFEKAYDKLIRQCEDSVEQLATTDEKCKTHSGLYWYHGKLFQLYLEHGSYRKVQKATSIPYRTIGEAIIKARDHIKKQVDDNL